MKMESFTAAEDSQVDQLAEKEAKLESMIHNCKKANVYQVKSKEELFGNKLPKGVKAVMKTAEFPGSNRRHIINGKKDIPSKLGKRKTISPPVQLEEVEQHIVVKETELEQFVMKYGSFVLSMVAIGSGLYLLWLSKKQITKLVKEGSSMEL